jgi:hypothetical protein
MFREVRTPDGVSWRVEIVGYRAARRRVGEVAADIRAGVSPGDLGFVAREPSS